MTFARLLILCCVPTTPLASMPSVQEVLHNWKGEAPGDRLGAIDYAGDVNQDGTLDLIVGAPGADANGLDSGLARIYSGQDGSVLYEFVGSSTNPHFGSVSAGGGDVNGDGVPDIILGAPLADEGAVDSGAVYVYSGCDGGLLYLFAGSSSGSFFGSAVANAGDVNADGYADVLTGNRLAGGGGYEKGLARVYSGFDGSILYELRGSGDGHHFGQSVDGLGDIDQDGYDDFVVGSPGEGMFAEGRAHVYSGRDGSLLFTFADPVSTGTLGDQVAGAGDVDGDGIPDIVSGGFESYDRGLQSGSASVFSGADGSLLYRFLGYESGGYFGWVVDGAGDVDGDGFADVIVGAIYESQTLTVGGGSARVFSGRDGSVLLNLLAKSNFALFGISVSTAGDVNGDGRDDVAIGAAEADSSFPDAGQAIVVSMVPPFLYLGLEDGNPKAVLRARQLRPHTLTWLFSSIHGVGARAIRPLNVVLDLHDPVRVMGPQRSDGQGNLVWPVVIPSKVSQRAIWLQMAQDGLKTNVTGGMAFP